MARRRRRVRARGAFVLVVARRLLAWSRAVRAGDEARPAPVRLVEALKPDTVPRRPPDTVAPVRARNGDSTATGAPAARGPSRHAGMGRRHRARRAHVREDSSPGARPPISRSFAIERTAGLRQPRSASRHRDSRCARRPVPTSRSPAGRPGERVDAQRRSPPVAGALAVHDAAAWPATSFRPTR